MDTEASLLNKYIGTSYAISTEQFMYLGSNASAITTSAINPYTLSPLLSSLTFYEFEYWLGLTNSSTGAITLGWANTSVTRFIADVVVNPTAGGTAYAGINPRTSTANAGITGGAVAATHWINIKGFVLNGSTSQAFPIQVSVASGNITPVSGSWFRFSEKGISLSGTGNVSSGLLV